jgi:hypothetical protein
MKPFFEEVQRKLTLLVPEAQRSPAHSTSSTTSPSAST